jgi:hypothetical protein
MELVLLQVDPPNFLIRHLPAGRVFPAIQATGHLQPFGSRRARDQIHDRFISAKRLQVGSLQWGAACSAQSPAAIRSQACCRQRKLKGAAGASQSGKTVKVFPHG